jgi:hypothetical protein
MEENTRRSQRIIDAELLQEAGAEENRLIVSGGQLLIKSRSGTLIHVGDIANKNYHRHNFCYYIKTEEGFLICDIGAYDGSQEKAEEDKPEPESGAIKLYYYKGKLYRQTKDGVIAEDKNILQEILQH